MRDRCGVSLCVTLCLCLLSLQSIQAQKTTGTITGTVADASGAVVPGATVKLIHRATGSSRTTVSNDQGSFSFPELNAGTYAVTVTKAGFKQNVSENVELHVADVTNVPVKLEVGSQAETVTVEANAIQVETQSGAVGGIMLGQQVRELPLNGRNFVQLTTLVPGASVAEGFDNKNKGLLAGVDISFSGAPSNANQWTVDGANNNDIGSQRTILIYPSVDGIEEFKILTNSYGPEFGGAGGAQINVVTKGGSNQYHGDAYYFGRNDVLNAKSYFLGQNTCTSSNDPACRKQMLRRNDWGYTFGGPIVKDKAFFFWSEEWNRERRGAVRQAQVPTAQERTGDFRDCGGPLLTSVSPGGQAYASQTPLPTTANPCAVVNWISSVNIPLNWREENIRGDWNITKNNSLMLKYTQDAWANPNHAYEEGGLWGDQFFPAVSDTWLQPGKMAVAKLTTTLGPNTVNDFQFSWSANRIHILRAGDNPQLNAKIVAAMPLVYPSSGKLHGKDLPEQICWCSTYFGILSPWDNAQDLYTWKDDFSKVTGKHTFKFGILVDRNSKNEEAGEEAGGLWGPTGMATNNWGGTDGSAHGLYVNMLTRGMLWGANENASNSISPVRWRDYEPYAGDSWKIHRRLTLDFGIRYSFIRPEFLENNRMAGFDPALYNPALGGDPCNGIAIAAGGQNTCGALGSKAGTISKYRSLRPANDHMVAPRVGFAWDVFGTGRLAIRGGVGQFYARDPIGLTLRMASTNPPFAIGGGGEHTLDDCTTAGLSACTSAMTTGVNLFDWAVGGTPGQGFENNTNLSNSWQWNFTTETALTRNSKLQLGWVALRGIHLNSAHDANQIAPQYRLENLRRGIPCEGGGKVAGPNGCGQGAGDRKDLYPLGDLTTNQITIWDHRGDSIYHSLQAMYSARWGKTSILQTSYTWSRNIATTTLGYVGTSTAVPDSYNSRANRGLADFDRRHVFNTSLVYTLPALQGQNSLLRAVAGNWETSTVVNVATGPHLTISGGVNNLTYTYPDGKTTSWSPGNPWGVANAGQFGARPNVTSASCSTSNRLQGINPAAFTYNGFVLGGLPNAGPGQCAGPGTADVDFALDKNWNVPWHGGKFLGESARMQFRLESFNLFNHPMFRYNNTNLSFQSDGGSLVNNTIQGSTLQSGSQFGHTPLASTIGNREIQFAMKLLW